MAHALIGSASALLVTVLAILALRPIAVAVELLDRPGGRKTHHGAVPIVGGLAMFLGIVFGMNLVPLPPGYGLAVLSASALLVTVGLLDDRFDLSPWARLPTQLLAPIIVFGANLSGTAISLGDPLGLGEVVFESWLSILVLVILVAGAVNAFNMMDGMDGLAGAVALVACIGLAFLCGEALDEGSLMLALVVAGSVTGFLFFNAPVQANRAMRCFMGDGGSTLLGFLIALLCLRLSQGDPDRSVSPIAVLWVVAMPIYELVWTIVRRVSRGQSPFRPDREHLHHLLLDSGVSVSATFVCYVLISAFFTSCGIAINFFEVSDPLAFFLFALAGAITVRSCYRAGTLARHLPDRFRRERNSFDV